MPAGTDRSAGDGGRRSPEETKQEIIEAASRFLWDRPFRDLGVTDLMQATSVGRSSFYVHFKDRYELAAELLGAIDHEIVEAGEDLRSQGPGAGMLRATLHRIVSVWARHGPVIRAISEASAQDSRLEHVYRWDFVERSVERVTAVVEHAGREGWVIPEHDPAETGALIALMAERYLCDRLGRHPQADPSEVVVVLTSAIERILGADRGEGTASS